MDKSIKDIKATKKVTKDLISELDAATNEKGVEHAYWGAIKATFKEGLPSDADQTDGFIRIKYVESELFLLMEFKFNKHLKKRINAMEVLIQIIFYMHALRDSLASVPNVIMVGDKNDVFVMNTKPLMKYLDRDDVNWEVSPSSAAKTYFNTMVVDLYNDVDINYYPHAVHDTDFNFNSILRDIAILMTNSQEKIKLTPNNINAAFDQFISQVITSNKFSAEELVNIFITVATERKSKVFFNSNASQIRVNNYTVSINKNNYRNFVSHFEEQYRPSEKRIFTAISDRLIQDIQRRTSGEFYTPSSFVKYATDQFKRYLGSNWNNDYVVWDPAWGTGNLTRDNRFANLFASTLNQADLDQGHQYNVGAHKFIFDFLNDDIDFETQNLFGYESDKLPKELIEILTKHPDTKFLFFVNPPYGTAGNANSKDRKAKTGISDSKIKIEMRTQHLKVQEQLYAQFIYRIIKMKIQLNLQNVYLGLYSPTLLITGSKYDKFRKLFLKNFKFIQGNIFQASNFADVKSNWAIDFSIWKGINSHENKVQNVFPHNILQLNSTGEVKVKGTRVLWNTDGIESLQDYLNKNTEKKSKLTKHVLQFKSRYVTNNKTVAIPQNAIGFLVNDTNNVEASAKGVYLMSSPITRHIKTSMITANSLVRQMIVFAARKVIGPTWVNQKDEFLAPVNENTPEFKQLSRKAVIYSIFSPNNNIISYRQDYLDSGVSCLNSWFFMDVSEIKELADKYNNDMIYNDCIEYADVAPVYSYLQHTDLDDEDRKLLNLARKIVRDTFKFRKLVNDDNAKISLNTWDASWNQIMQVAKEYVSNDVIEFNNIFKDYSMNIENLVYINGILKR